ncbi:MAG: exosortase/archaeosortase family protein [Bryobacteraceae bacterium]|nr:exosortase/archaeosortase family protein [Bryobacteraceae bacterium]
MTSPVHPVNPSEVVVPGTAGPPGREVPWGPLAWFFTLIAICYFPMLQALIGQWSNDEDMGHGFFVPVIAAYIAWQHRDELLATPLQPSYWGLPLLLWGAFQLTIGNLGAELFLQRTAIIFTIVGAVWLVCGTRILRIVAFPLFLLVFMVPLPAVIYNKITFPLQIFASVVAETTLNLIGIPALREGNVLDLPNNKLSVIEACSGIRSLLSLTFLSLVYGYFFDRKSWVRPILLLGVIPIAIIANAARVTITGIISEYDRELAQGVFHTLEGWVIFMIAFVLLGVLHQTVNWIYNMVQKARTEPTLS